MTMSQIDSAEEKLRIAGILPSLFAQTELPVRATPLPADEPASYSGEEISRAAGEDSGFKAVLDSAEQTFGKMLTRDEMSRLLNIYRNLGLPADVILVLFHYCSRLSDRRPTMRFIERHAYRWVDLGIADSEQAERFAEEQMVLRSRRGSLLDILGLQNTKLTEKREQMLDSWIRAGYTDAQIEEAYDVTLKNTNRLAWEYMDKVLVRMADQGVSSAPSLRPLPQSVIRNER